MKVKIEFTMEVDAENWAENFGINQNNPAEIREDIKGYFRTHCHDQLIHIGCSKEDQEGKY